MPSEIDSDMRTFSMLFLNCNWVLLGGGGKLECLGEKLPT